MIKLYRIKQHVYGYMFTHELTCQSKILFLMASLLKVVNLFIFCHFLYEISQSSHQTRLLQLENLFYSIAKHNTADLELFTYHGEIMVYGFQIQPTNHGLNLQTTLCITAAFLHGVLVLSSVEHQLQGQTCSFIAEQQRFKRLVSILCQITGKLFSL